jgi:hypothetical protein
MTKQTTAEITEALKAALWRIAAADPTHSQFASLAIREARAALEAADAGALDETSPRTRDFHQLIERTTR